MATDYEKKYKEALERAKRLTSDMTTLQKIREFIFPELAESEDEKIRKELVAFFKAMQDSPWHEEYWHDLEIVRILAYLEKQKDEEGYEEIPVESTLEYKLGFKAGKDWKPSEEQMDALHRCVDYLHGEGSGYFDPINSLYEQLKKL